MPKENRKRGRREEKKWKREEAADEAVSPKRQKSQDFEDGDVEIIVDGDHGAAHQQQEEVYVPLQENGPGEIQFYGLLDDQEQEYFRQADSMLELNRFADANEKTLFLGNLWKETKGKELKVANSQSCSRLMERLIAASTPQQLKVLWKSFNGHFLNLFQHRFASHCCEALFRKAAPSVILDVDIDGKDEEAQISLEDLFLSCVSELEGNWGYLIADQFASHPLRVLLVVLSGMPLEGATTTSLLQSKKKEHNVSARTTAPTEPEPTTAIRPVPDSFHTALETIISGTTATLDTTTLRALATHPIANPVLQLLLTLALTRSSKQTAIKDPKSLFRLLFPDDPPIEGTESAAFVTHLLYEPIGSRLLEVIITNAPGRAFKTLFRSLFKEKLGSMARNETAAFVVVKILERLGKEDLDSALGPICSEISTLAQRSRTGVVKTLIERCRIRGLDEAPIADALRLAYGDDPADRLSKIISISFDLSAVPDTTNMSADRKRNLDDNNPTKIHGSLLAQTMYSSPGPLRDLVTDSILALDIPSLLIMAQDRTSSRVLQTALTSPNQDAKFRRQLIPPFYPHIADLTIHPVASHLVDALWEATTELRFMREQIAEALLRNEETIRTSVPGRAVWRNWSMDMYKTRRRDWLNLAGLGVGDQPVERKKTGIELARERFAAKGQKQRKKGGEKGKVAWGANAVAVKGSA